MTPVLDLPTEGRGPMRCSRPTRRGRSSLRDNRNFGDFRHWKDHDVYQKTLARLLRDLRVEPAGAKQTDHHPTDRRGRS